MFVLQGKELSLTQLNVTCDLRHTHTHLHLPLMPAKQHVSLPRQRPRLALHHLRPRVCPLLRLLEPLRLALLGLQRRR